MPVIWLIVIVLALAVAGFILGRTRAMQSAGGDRRHLHSLPTYYGSNVALKAAVPAILLMVVWLVAQPFYVNSVVSGMIPDSAVADGSSRGLVLAEVRRAADGLDNAVALGAISEEFARNARADFPDVTTRLKEAGQIVTTQITQPVLRAAQKYRVMNATGNMIMSGVVILIALLGIFWGLRETNKDFRARNVVEKSVLALLIAAASIAVLTTVGIVLSLIFNTIEFFRLYPASEFFGSLTWSPSFGGGSELGVLPLLWGTFYISLVALIVAVPIGLFAAVYLSEYASKPVRSFAKPMLEVLAGIPTIVYGLFALLTIGPMLLSAFGPDGTGWMSGQRAVVTAGLAMGIMLIPFVSSLSDDIINAVPMIVVLGAGAAARLSMNPFDAMTTVTAKIVSQLTGDNDFASPEALVAFALGMTLFIITLGLNVFALYIVRKYREQYE